MKRILFLFATLVLLCIFSLSVGAVTGARSDEFGEVTYVSGVNENTEIKDKTSRVVLLNSDGTYTTYPAYYISDVRLQWQGTVQYKFDALNAALGTSYSMDSIVRVEILTDSTVMNQNGGSYQNRKNLKEVVFPSGTQIKEIGGQQFKASGLEKIIIPATVTKLGTHVFEACGSLKDVSFAEGFSITSIPNQMFTLCSSLEKIVLPDSVESIGAGCFSGCTILSEVWLGENFKSMGNQAFARCNGKMVIYAPSTFLEGMSSITTSLFSYDSGDMHEVTLFFAGEKAKAEQLVSKATHRGLKEAVLVEWDPSKSDSYYASETSTHWTIVYSYNMCSHVWSDEESAAVDDFLSPISVGKACIKCQTVSITKTISPIFEYAGYSVTEKADASGKYYMTAGYIINHGSVEQYKQYGTLEYGFVVSFVSEPLTVSGGKATLKGATGAYAVALVGVYDFYDVKIGGLSEAQNGLAVALCIYVCDGEDIYYIGEQGQSAQPWGIPIEF